MFKVCSTLAAIGVVFGLITLTAQADALKSKMVQSRPLRLALQVPGEWKVRESNNTLGSMLTVLPPMVLTNQATEDLMAMP